MTLGGTTRTSRHVRTTSTIEGKSDVQRMGPKAEIDPKATLVQGTIASTCQTSTLHVWTVPAKEQSREATDARFTRNCGCICDGSFEMSDLDFAGWIKLAIPDDCTHPRRWRQAVSARPTAKAKGARTIVLWR